MSIEYRDGTFSDIMEYDEILEKWAEAIIAGTARSLHVGTPAELEKIKHRAELDKRLTQLEKRLAVLEDGPTQSAQLVIPTRDEIIAILRTQNLGAPYERKVHHTCNRS